MANVILTLGIFLASVVGFVFLIIAFYVLARAASVGWHKSKLEYLEKVRRLKNRRNET